MVKPIFTNYTGSPFINNALQTIEVLAGYDHVSEITTETLLRLYEEHKIWELYKRMKSYSMLFSRNGPLLNDKDFGDKIFKGIIEYILNNFETEGSFQCEISGLRFDTPFACIYEKVLNEVKYPVKKIKGKDKTINRCWFPLTGALGSDAQALPQAIYDIKIHPICLVIVQFLPFSALLYKGGILLLDTVNFDFSKDFITESVYRVLQEIEITSSNKSIKNIRDFSQGDYILKAIRIYSEKNMDYEDYTDLNMWSFSNSGTGARCEIDRIPNRTFKTLYQIYRTNSKCKEDLKNILKKSYAGFLDCLIESRDYYGLYPRKVQVKKGKKTETLQLEGVSVDFFDAYQHAIHNDKHKDYAKYSAFLINGDKDLKKEEIKLLGKLEPHKEPEYNKLVFGVLLRAAQQGKWSLQNYLEIIDETDETVIKSWIYGILKMVHFYYYKSAFSSDCPIHNTTKLTPMLSTIIHLIENDDRSVKSIDRLQDQQNFKTFNIKRIFIRNHQDIDLAAIVDYIYDDYLTRTSDLNKLLRLYFNQKGSDLEFRQEYISSFHNENHQQFQLYQSFVEMFQTYYLEKYNNDVSKYKRHVLVSFPSKTKDFIHWIRDVLEKMKEYYKGNPDFDNSQLGQIEEELFYDPNGKQNISFSQFAIEFLLNKQFTKSFFNNKIEII